STYGAKMPRAEWSSIGNMYLPVPKLEEQKQIVNFLNKITSKIDLEIQKSQKLVELIKEKREAIINQSVTKGLDPNVPMKDSGIEWIGEIPERWNISKLNLLLKKSISYGVLVPEEDKNGIPMIRSGELESKGGIERNVMYIPKSLDEQFRKTRLEGGEILI